MSKEKLLLKRQELFFRKEVMPVSHINLEGMDKTELQKLLTPRLTKYIPFEATPKQSAFLLMNNTKEILYGGAA